MPIDLDHADSGSDWLKRSSSFTLTGTTRIPSGRRRQAAVTWNDDGTVSGDNSLAAEAERLAASAEWVKATPTGPGREAALDSLEAAAILLASLFEAFDYEGDFPDDLLDVDAGAIP